MQQLPRNNQPTVGVALRRAGSAGAKALLLLCSLVSCAEAQGGWWVKPPIRWVQTNRMMNFVVLE
jgi:hypothetical protein